MVRQRKSVPYVQYGYGMPVFMGQRIQRGNGIGGIFGNLAKNLLMPALKNIGTSLLSSGLRKATGAIEDIGGGKSVKSAFKDRFIGRHTPSSFVKSGAKRAASHLLHELSDSDVKRPRKRRRPNRSKGKNHRRRRDVFDTL